MVVQIFTGVSAMEDVDAEYPEPKPGQVFLAVGVDSVASEEAFRSAGVFRSHGFYMGRQVWIVNRQIEKFMTGRCFEVKTAEITRFTRITF